MMLYTGPIGQIPYILGVTFFIYVRMGSAIVDRNKIAYIQLKSKKILYVSCTNWSIFI